VIREGPGGELFWRAVYDRIEGGFGRIRYGYIQVGGGGALKRNSRIRNLGAKCQEVTLELEGANPN
jgi:hypothetical protein